MSPANSSQEDDRLILDITPPQSLCSDPSASQTFILDNGDTISYSTYGPAFNDAIFLLHGWSGSRMHGLFFHSLAEELGARIICPDRPGIGLSTPSPNRTLLDYPNTIAQLARHLDLNTYRILGWSGGGPFVLACAQILSREQLLRVSVLAEMGSSDTSLDESEWVRGEEKKDLEDLFAADPGAMEVKIESLLLGSWGFDLKSLEAEVMLWYGTADINVSILVGREMAKKLKKAKLKEYEGIAYFTIFKHHAKEILRDLLQD
ncbi:MAG: hypothetical protein ASARMPREDX12_007776 [Alectoria sarmentosa]|nr:MAG: hypothetical protein ASARMPREDX12_007776 [Alectoria sarmentosa]